MAWSSGGSVCRRSIRIETNRESRLPRLRLLSYSNQVVDAVLVLQACVLDRGSRVTPELFTVVSDETVSDHRYVHVVPSDSATFARRLAESLEKHYFDRDTSRQALVRAAEELSVFSGNSFNLEDIEAALHDELDAALPADLRDRPEPLGVQRSEFAEIVASEVLKEVFGTSVPASRIRHKEVPDQQTRGADIVGLEQLEAMHAADLILSEVKASQDRVSPPGVVADMVTKLTSLLTRRRTLLQELIWVRDHASEEYAEICGTLCATYSLKKETFRIIIAPILVRSAATHSDDDPGVFRTHPHHFGRSVRWVSIVIDADLLQIARQVYRIAREGQP